MKKIVAVLAAAAVAVGALAAAPAATAAPARTPDFTPAPINWGDCASASLKNAGAQCGFLVVPMDYAKPAGAKVEVAVSRIKHKAAQYQGIMLVNPGGPGGSGLGLSRLGQSVPNHAGDSYDWIGFDPRGVGSSKPAVTCDGNYFGYDRTPYVPKTPQIERAWLGKAQGYAKACAKNGAILDHIKTTDVAQDMDSLRKALGEKQINYYGFSYGTYLGQVYSTLFPGNVRRMVLDGNVDPRNVWYQANLDQDVAFDRNIKIYFGWLAKYDSVYHLGKTAAAVEKLWYDQQKKLDRTPAGGVIGGDEWTDVFLQAGYYVFGWEDMAKAFDGWVHRGDWQTLKALYDDSNPPGDDNGYAVYSAVQCSDVQWPTNWNRWRLDNWTTYFRAPFETWGNAWFNAPCVNWPAKSGKPVHVDGSKVDGALLISEELDAATPYEGSREVRKLFPKSSLISAPGGTTHAGSLSGVACVDDKVADYLATGNLPKRTPGNHSDAQCEPVPQPVPAGAAGGQPKADTQPGAQIKQDALARLLHF
ncbi:alpha/beta hydrolase [Amycolatopsis saalfeldensis]|uniref:Alpha/beta hydrolase fold n=1 Tax=Amycolatopsis saalfeldensis TaxID=394193 RepID=A0A1H8W2X1_9PSEU|nr:alpha/beta hydrolase [Amycolatopsis saalfeldensis]SEP21992.1 alpha/beta hydrolase fold [Amycolatopsis saalfeldensis]